METMAYVIRNYETGEFYAQEGWVKERIRAKRLPSFDEGVSLCKTQTLKSAEALMVADGDAAHVHGGIRIS